MLSNHCWNPGKRQLLEFCSRLQHILFCCFVSKCFCVVHAFELPLKLHFLMQLASYCQSKLIFHFNPMDFLCMDSRIRLKNSGIDWTSCCHQANGTRIPSVLQKSWWRRRWLSHRVFSQYVIANLHTLYPKFSLASLLCPAIKWFRLTEITNRYLMNPNMEVARSFGIEYSADELVEAIAKEIKKNGTQAITKEIKKTGTALPQSWSPLCVVHLFLDNSFLERITPSHYRLVS